jgi:putative zinc finger/helix-turn-helix YgiT family protein
MVTEAETLFEYSCPECGIGVVQTTKIRNYKTKIKGYPFLVDEARIGVCNHCRAEHFAPEETQRWEELFARSLEARQAFLAPEEITALRTALGLSMEDFARLIGTTRQSLSAWEKPGRASPPSRTADLLMKLVRQSLHSKTVDVLTSLLEEAKKWGIVIQLRSSAKLSVANASIILRPKSGRQVTPLHHTREFALAADTALGEEAPLIVETMDGRPIGELRYDYERAALMLDLTGDLPPWQIADIEIETQDGQHFTRQGVLLQERCVVLPETQQLREKDIAQITLKVQHQEPRG